MNNDGCNDGNKVGRNREKKIKKKAKKHDIQLDLYPSTTDLLPENKSKT